MTPNPLPHHAVARHAVSTPHRTAVVEGRHRVDYAELSDSAGRLAALLAPHGAGPGTTVGIGLPPGVARTAAVLGAHHTGAAVLLLDPDLSAAHRAARTADSGAAVLVTGADHPPAGAGEPPVVRLPADLKGLPAEPAPSPAGDCGAAALISYGHGDTGHLAAPAAVTAYARRLAAALGLTGDDVVLQTGCDDEATTHALLHATLLTGATLVGLPGGGPDAVTAAAARHGATVLAGPADTLAELAGHPGLDTCAALRLAVACEPGLDPDPAEEAGELLAGRTGITFHALLGAAGTGAAVAHLTFDARGATTVTPFPLDDRPDRLLLLDESGTTPPPGVPGELHVTGAGTELCFHGRPDLTAERFVPLPGGRPGERAHRTGQLARYTADGTLELLGPAGDEPGDDLWFGDDTPLLDSDRPTYVAPRTPQERTVAAVWADLLAASDIGADDHFFQLGGHSLLLTTLAERLTQAGGKQIGLADLYTASTVAEQAALLETAGDVTAGIRPAPRDRPLPLSAGQRRLWFLNNANPGSPEWIIPLFLRLPAGVGPGAVRHALDQLAERHESLRTRYHLLDGEPVQEVVPAGPVDLRVLDCGPGELAAAVRDRFEDPFDLGSGTLWRALLLRDGGDSQLLFVTAHHIACDGWSATVLEREFHALLGTGNGGVPAPLPPLPVQYADYAAWQNTTGADDAAAAAGLDHWRTELAGLPGLDLPTDHPRPAERDPRGGLVPLTVPAALADAVVALGQRHGTTPFTTLLTAFATVLARTSGQWDVGVGVPVAGRDRPETAGTVGFFLNSVVLRCRLDPALEFGTALDRVRETGRAGFAHQDVSFDRLVEELRPDRDPSRTPLYQVAFNYNEEQVTGGMPGEADHDLLLGARRVAKTDLTLYLRREPGGTLTGVLEYATSLFERHTVEALAGHLVELLRSATADPARRLAALDLLPAAERAAQPHRWQGERADWPAGAVIDLFEAQAAATPGVTAVIAGPQRRTYRELDLAADRIAHRLAALGAGPDTLLAVCLDRGIPLVEALLGVWKAGAGYVPLDPANPPERLRQVLADCAAPVVVTTADLTAATEGHPGTRLLLDTTDTGDAGDQPPARLPRHTDPEHLAYVIHTSGSTGRPKGVMITHRGLANHLRWAARDLTAGPGGAPLFSSVAFDLPATNLFVPLITGRAVHLLPAGQDPARLGDALMAGAPHAFVKLTPGHLELLADQLTPEQIDALAHTVLVAGEALPARTAAHWLAALGPGRLVNEYGPTETAIGATVHPVDHTPHTTVPLGGPLPNVTGYVLDADGHPVPDGLPGELHLGGPGVARGYLGRPDLTAERFVPDPHGTPGGRLYRTGDLVRRLPDGALAFLGRTDDQVKIRGYRIEPREIEARLADDPDVRTAVVTVRPDGRGDPALTGYLVPEPGHPIDTARVRERLAAVLPAHMVPAVLTPLETVPLTANGKVDLRALPDPAPAAPAPVPPATPTEERVAALWADLLGTENPGVEDNFFDHGGHSILAIRLTSRLQDAFGLDLTIRLVLENPTVRGQARAVEELIRAEIDAMTEAELNDQNVTAKEQQA